MHSSEWQAWLMPVITLSKTAGDGLLPYFELPRENLAISHKHDDTHLTAADLYAHQTLFQGLSLLTPEIPILSEEGDIPEFSIRKQWDAYWLLDPLDGTRGFIDGCNEFTVNVALIVEGRPVLGVVYAPALKALYYASEGQGAFKIANEQSPQMIQTEVMNWQSFRVLLGHYLQSATLQDYLLSVPGCQVVRLNSSLKFCWIAEGRADFYPRFGKTSEWDTAAAHCILNEASGALVDFNGEALQYNAKDSLENPAFIGIGDLSQITTIIELMTKKRK